MHLMPLTNKHRQAMWMLLVHCTMLCVRFGVHSCFAVACVTHKHGLVLARGGLDFWDHGNAFAHVGGGSNQVLKRHIFHHMIQLGVAGWLAGCVIVWLLTNHIILA